MLRLGDLQLGPSVISLCRVQSLQEEITLLCRHHYTMALGESQQFPFGFLEMLWGLCCLLIERAEIVRLDGAPACASGDKHWIMIATRSPLVSVGRIVTHCN